MVTFLRMKSPFLKRFNQQGHEVTRRISFVILRVLGG